MTGVFLSYSRSDRVMARRLVDGLRSVGVDVWWDEDMPGVDWQEELERRITDLSIVIVLWTPNSSGSKNVRDEARLGLKSDKLLNLLSGVTEPPFPFDRVNGLPLDGWDGLGAHRGWTRAVETVERLMVADGFASPGEIAGRLAAREQRLRALQSEADHAQASFAEAQAAEGDAVAAGAAADEALARARSDLVRAEDMQLGAAIVRAAQQEFDLALVSRERSEAACRAAKAKLAEASRELSRSRAEMETFAALPSASADARPLRIEPGASPSASLQEGSASRPAGALQDAARASLRDRIRLPRAVVRFAALAATCLLIVFVALRLTLTASGGESLASVEALMPSERLSMDRAGS